MPSYRAYMDRSVQLFFLWTTRWHIIGSLWCQLNCHYNPIYIYIYRNSWCDQNYIMPATNSRYIFICKYICIYVKVSVCIGLYLNAAAWHCHTFFAIYPNPTSCKPCFWSPKRKKSSFWSEKAIYQACWLSWARKQFKVCHLNVPSQCAINSEYVLLKMA